MFRLPNFSAGEAAGWLLKDTDCLRFGVAFPPNSSSLIASGARLLQFEFSLVTWLLTVDAVAFLGNYVEESE